MKPTRALANTLSTLLAADTTTLANAVGPKVGVIVADFTPSIDRVMADLTISAAASLAPIAVVFGVQNESIDPVTGELIVELRAPAGGFRWETTGGFVGPVTVYGFAVGNNAMTNLYATEKLAAPVTLLVDNQSVNAPPLQLRIDPTQVH